MNVAGPFLGGLVGATHYDMQLCPVSPTEGQPVLRDACRGYTRWLPLLDVELRALPWLIRLRGAITVLRWLGRRNGPHGPQIVLERMACLRNVTLWLERYEQAFIDVILEEVR